MLYILGPYHDLEREVTYRQIRKMVFVPNFQSRPLVISRNLQEKWVPSKQKRSIDGVVAAIGTRNKEKKLERGPARRYRARGKKVPQLIYRFDRPQKADVKRRLVIPSNRKLPLRTSISEQMNCANIQLDNEYRQSFPTPFW